MKFYDLDKSEFKVPIILGPMVNKWKSTLPMLFVDHYAQYLTLPQTKVDP